MNTVMGKQWSCRGGPLGAQRWGLCDTSARGWLVHSQRWKSLSPGPAVPSRILDNDSAPRDGSTASKNPRLQPLSRPPCQALAAT